MTAVHTVNTGREATSGPQSPVADLANALAEIEKGQQLAGHFPDEDAMDRARRVLTGEISKEDAMQEIRRKYNQE